jgi:hypothetical protein
VDVILSTPALILQYRKPIFFAWFADGNGIPNDCIVIVPTRQTKLEVGIKAPSGWQQIEPEYEKNLITLNVRIGRVSHLKCNLLFASCRQTLLAMINSKMTSYSTLALMFT